MICLPARRPGGLPRALLALAGLGAALAGSTLPAAPAAASDVLFALTRSAELISVRSEVPGLPYARRQVTGLPGGAVPLTLSSRPGTGQLVLGAREGAHLSFYAVSPSTGNATRISAGSAPIGGLADVASADFVPATGVLRLLTPAGNHVLVNPATGATTAQAAPAYAAGDPAAKTKPRPIGVAHTPDGQTLVFDGARRAFTRMPSPASGELFTLGAVHFPIEERSALAVSPAEGRLFAAVSDAGEQQTNLYAAEPGTFLPAYIGPFPDKDPIIGLAVGAGGLFDFDRQAYRTREADGSVRVVIERSGTISAAADVDFELVGDTATAGEDFPPTAGVLAFAPGQDRAGVDLPVYADTRAEGEEVAKIRMTQTGGPAGFGYRRQARVAIVDGGAKPAGASAPTIIHVPAATQGTKATKAVPVRLSLTVSAPRVRTIGRTLKVKVKCSSACRLVAEAKLDRKSARRVKRPAVLGVGTRTLRKGGRGTVTVKVARYSKRLRKVRKGTITLTVKGYSLKSTSKRKVTVKTRVRRR